MPIEWKQESEDLAVCRVSGRLSFEEFASIQASPAEIEQAERKISSLVFLDDFEGWDEAEEWGELRFVEGNDALLKKVAVVGELRWKDQMEMFMLKGLRPVDIEYFGPDDEDLARLWLTQD